MGVEDILHSKQYPVFQNTTPLQIVQPLDVPCGSNFHYILSGFLTTLI